MRDFLKDLKVGDRVLINVGYGGDRMGKVD